MYRYIYIYPHTHAPCPVALEAQVAEKRPPPALDAPRAQDGARVLRPGGHLHGRLAEPQVHGLEGVAHLVRVVADRGDVLAAELAPLCAPPALLFMFFFATFFSFRGVNERGVCV